MKKLFVFAAALLCAGAAFAQDDRVIYGDDDRIDLYQTTDKRLLKLADSTVALFSGVTIADGVAKLPVKSYAQAYNLCPQERFYDQVNGAFCSGSLVAPDIIMTAGHCVKSEAACATTKFVFGFAVNKQGVMPNTVPAGEVYSCGKLLGREQVNNGADWALIKLDRPVPNHTPLKYNTRNTLKNGDMLFVIGHPAGLPTKIAGGATVRDNSKPGYFVANLDTYGGNSGSAVFNARTGSVVGILVRGENDYVYNGNCRVSNVCASDACRGEDVTKLSAIPGGIPARPLPYPVAKVEPQTFEEGTRPAFEALASMRAFN